MTLALVKCPKCKETKVSKNGTENGVQRYLCRNQDCPNKSFMLDYIYNGCKPGIDETIINMTANASGISDISRVLKVSEGKISSVLKKRKTQ